MTERASERYRKGIIKLWQATFGDEENFINSFLDNMNYRENMIIYTENNQVLAMASMLPVFCGKNKGRYVYAVAVTENQRGRGLGKAIMEAVDNFIKGNNEQFAILVPASESLFDFYNKLGYCQTIYRPDYDKIPEGLKQCGVSEYYKIRDRIFSERDFIRWEIKELEYILSFGKTELCSGGAVYCEDGTVKELLSPVIFEKEWTVSFAQIKYYDDKLKFDRPYFGLCMN